MTGNRRSKDAMESRQLRKVSKATGRFHRFIILETKLVMAEAGWSGSSSANRWLTLSVVLPCFRATKPNSLARQKMTLGTNFKRNSPNTVSSFIFKIFSDAVGVEDSNHVGENLLHWTASFFAPSKEKKKMISLNYSKPHSRLAILTIDQKKESS